MAIFRTLDEEVFKKIRMDIFHTINSIEKDSFLSTAKELATLLKDENPVRSISISWDNFKTDGHRFRDFLNERDDMIEGALFKFSAPVDGDATLCNFLCDYIRRSRGKIYDAGYTYISFSIEVLLFGPDKNDPYKIASHKKDAIEYLKGLVEDINDISISYKAELDHFIDKQIEYRKDKIRSLDKFYEQIDKIK